MKHNNKTTNREKKTQQAATRPHKEDPTEHITETCLFKYIENFTTKNGKFSNKKFWFFSYFCSKHRLWVCVRTASRSKIRKIMYTLVNPSSKKWIKVGFKRGQIYICVFSWCTTRESLADIKKDLIGFMVNSMATGYQCIYCYFFTGTCRTFTGAISYNGVWLVGFTDTVRYFTPLLCQPLSILP